MIPSLILAAAHAHQDSTAAATPVSLPAWTFWLGVVILLGIGVHTMIGADRRRTATPAAAAQDDPGAVAGAPAHYGEDA